MNDAPALKQAEVGTAMGITGSEVAKEAAKIVLANDEFSVIPKAIRVGRGVFDNLVKLVRAHPFTLTIIVTDCH